ncbi:hypothetical protein CYG49_02205 [Candidatus Saccharibacteria bacterium]|nr:MAG: hypothetical protein CYG49_02205 [Candidatus Saccharibacteria bacterium]
MLDKSYSATIGHYYFRVFLTGVLVAVAITAGFMGIMKLTEPLYEGMLGLGTTLPIIIIALAISIALAAGISLLLLPKREGVGRISLLVFGIILVLEIFSGVALALPQLNALAWIGLTAIAAGVVYILLGAVAVFSLSRVVRIVIFILLVVGMGAASASQYHAGRIRAQVWGLENAGYDIYIPAASPDLPKVSYIRSLSDNYSGHSEGVSIDFKQPVNNRNKWKSLYEYKFSGNYPMPDCSNGYQYNPWKTQGGTYSCTLESEFNGNRIYLHEQVLAIEHKGIELVDQKYFAIAGTTVIWSSDKYSFKRNMATSEVLVDPYSTDAANSARHEQNRRILQSLVIADPQTYPLMVLQ